MRHSRRRLLSHQTIACLIIPAIFPWALRRTPVGLSAASAQSNSTAIKSAQSTPDSVQKITFTLETISDGQLSDKQTWWKTFTLIASNGQKLYLTSIPFRSAEHAQQFLDQTAEASTKIIRRGPELNVTGEVVGERILGQFSKFKSGQTATATVYHCLFWRSGSQYWQVDADDLADISSLEERLKTEGTRAVWGWTEKKHTN